MSVPTQQQAREAINRIFVQLTPAQQAEHRQDVRTVWQAIAAAPPPSAEPVAADPAQGAQGEGEAVADPQLLAFYQVSTVAELLAAQEAHILQLQDAAQRNVKPWEDTFPPTLLPKYIRDTHPAPQAESQLRARLEKAMRETDDGSPALFLKNELRAILSETKEQQGAGNER
jgi:hypothetical protein